MSSRQPAGGAFVSVSQEAKLGGVLVGTGSRKESDKDLKTSGKLGFYLVLWQIDVLC